MIHYHGTPITPREPRLGVALTLMRRRWAPVTV